MNDKDRLAQSTNGCKNAGTPLERHHGQFDKLNVEIQNNTGPDTMELIGMLSQSCRIHKYGTRTHVKK